MLRVTLLALVLIGLCSAAEARPRHVRHAPTVELPSCGGLFEPDCPAPRSARGRVRASWTGGGGSYLPHPEGCPRRLFCGCGAAVEVFGRSVRSLWLAANWLRFPRTSPAPGMAAARRGHVFVLRQHVRGDVWLVVDHNSGGHRSRLHERSIAGYAIVDPHG